MLTGSLVVSTHEVFSEENAREALKKLERIVELVSGFLIKVES
jgi:HEPN domain-containing protein